MYDVFNLLGFNHEIFNFQHNTIDHFYNGSRF